MKTVTAFVFILSLSLLAACSGGGSGNSNNTTDIEAPPVNQAPSQPQSFSLSFEAIKLFRFKWDAVEGASHYRLQENPDGVSGFSQVGEDIPLGTETFALEVPLYPRTNAQYLLQACNKVGCSDSKIVSVSDSLVESIGYFKASNTDQDDRFGFSVSLSEDGNTLAVGSYGESSNATGIDGDQASNDLAESGAVYVFVRTGTAWAQQAYVKASNTNEADSFGYSVSLSKDGSNLAVGAPSEDSNATGIDGDQDNNDAVNSGAAYVFVRTGTTWTQQTYVKASNTDGDDRFGMTVNLSGDGNTLAVGAAYENSDATGIDGDQANNDLFDSGAVYVFSRTGATWAQQAYLKASNTDELGRFGRSVSLSDDGNTLAVGAYGDNSDAVGIDGDQSNYSAFFSGAVYVFSRTGASWAQQTYIKASNTDENDLFGRWVSLSGDGNTLAVGAPREGSNAIGIDGDQANNDLAESGAVYVFVRTGTAWAQQAYVKASNTNEADIFGWSVSLSGDGNALAVGAPDESSNAKGIDGDRSNNAAIGSGAVYVFVRTGTTWAQQSYVKASNTDGHDSFGGTISLSRDGNTLAIGAQFENSNATGINGDQTNNDALGSGAVFIY
ncbi:FG-GAP repeat protein [uncultured Microbulbifer sp.]|uniref:FG-GAP repeat protein n=1 Tax=uncultured Microbulbifer sp. TaxID=348147 RepID=UPI002639A695|nr:FG-GAP repeat protein [uncultured Microbulbifer sp.]